MSSSIRALLESVVKSPKNTGTLNESIGRITNEDVTTYIKIFNAIVNGSTRNSPVAIGHRITRNGLLFAWYDHDEQVYNINNIGTDGVIDHMPLEGDIPTKDEVTLILSQMR